MHKLSFMIASEPCMGNQPTIPYVTTVEPPLSRLLRCGHLLQPGSYIWNFDLICNNMWVWFNVHTEHVHGLLLWQAKGKEWRLRNKPNYPQRQLRLFSFGGAKGEVVGIAQIC